MESLAFTDHRFSEPTTVVVEASDTAIHTYDLDFMEGEQFDTIRDVISISVTCETVTLNTCRTIEGWKAGRGRTTLEIPRKSIERMFV